LVRLLETPAGTPEKLHSILDYLRAHTLVEFKGPTDDLAGEDMLTLMGYGYQYMRLSKLDDPADVCLMVVADRLTRTFLSQAKRCRAELVETESGLWQGQLGGFALHGVETSKIAGLGSTERLLYLLSRAFLANPMGIQPLDPRDVKVYALLYQQVEQFKRARGAMAVKDIDKFDRSFTETIQSLDPEVKKKLLSILITDGRLGGLTPEEVVSALSPEQREQFKRLLH
jgi:hypothetical protein